MNVFCFYFHIAVLWIFNVFVLDVRLSGSFSFALDKRVVLWIPTVVAGWWSLGLVGVRLELESACDVLVYHVCSQVYVM